MAITDEWATDDWMEPFELQKTGAKVFSHFWQSAVVPKPGTIVKVFGRMHCVYTAHGRKLTMGLLPDDKADRE